jgi:hypothetical protein
VRRDGREIAPGRVAEDVHEQIRLGREVPIEGPRRHARTVRHLRDRDA